MNPFKYISGILCLSFLLSACSGTEEGLPPVAGYAGVSFTASQPASGTDATGSVDGLVDKGKVAVYVWQGNTPSEDNKPAYSNLYTFHVEGGSCKLDSVSGSMKLPVGNGYAFYALSGNDAVVAAPVMATGSRTATLRNGVDYLMAVNSSVNVSTDIVTVPLVFRHIATRIVLTVQPAGVNGYTSAGSLTAGIAPVDSTGSYIDLSKTWSDSSPNSMIYWGEGITGGTPLDQTDGQVKAGDKVESGPNFTVSFIILPVAADAKIPLQFDFTDIAFDTNGSAQAGKRYTARLTVPTGGLKGGYTYAYSVKISRRAAAFTTLPKVNPWVTDGINLDEVIEVDPK